jgi:WD40 repeat protein
MNFDDAVKIVGDFLKDQKKATNSSLIDLLDGDEVLFQKVREELIFNDIADDKKGVGLIYIEQEDVEAQDTKDEEELEATVELNDLIGRDENPRRIFISYGRKDAEGPARKLAEDLAKRGHEIWIDKEQLKTGKSWEEQIENAILGSDIFISLLSPHAVRRPDGVCLDEISMARYNSRKIIPLMVINCRPPLGIYRLDWLDFQDWNNPVNYQSLLEKIGGLFQTEEVKVEGTFATIFASLRPIDFKLDIYRHVKDFVGRTWLIKDIENWLKDKSSRLMFITGDPGTGKTALMAKLIHVFPQVAAYHFCISKFEISLVPERFIQSIAAQLATQIEAYREVISQLNIEAITSLDASSVFKLLLIEPLSKISVEEDHIIIIDGLDEALYYGNNNIVKLLHEWLDELPDWVKLVITSRKVISILSLFEFYKPYEIEVNKLENRKDIREYALGMLEQHCADISIGVRLNELANELADRSEGIFLYVKTVVQSIISGNIKIEELSSLPPGLGGMYISNFTRLYPNMSSFDEIRPILQVILAAYDALDARKIGEYLGVSELEVKQGLAKINEFFPEKDGTYSSFHKSIADWLSAYGYQDHPYLCDLVEGHTRILESLERQWEQEVISDYLLYYLPKHLYYSGKIEKLKKLLTDLDFLEKRCAVQGIYGLLEDYKLLISNEDSGASASSLSFWDEHMRQREIGTFHMEIGSDKKVWIVKEFVFRNAEFLQLYGNVSGFFRQQVFNQGINDVVYDRVDFELSQNSLVLNDSFRNTYDPFPSVNKTLYEHKLGIADISLSADGRTLVSASFDDTVKLWDLRNGACLRTIKYTETPESVTIASDGSFIAVAGLVEDFAVLVYDENFELLLYRLEGHTERVRKIKLSTDNRFLLSCGSDRTVKLWNLPSREMVYERCFVSKVLGCDISADGNIIALVTSENLVEVWNVEFDTLVFSKTLDKGEFRNVLLSRSCKELVIGGGNDKTTEIWDIVDDKRLYTIDGHGTITYDLFLDAADKILVTAGKDKYLKLWDFRTGTLLKTFEGHSRITRRIAGTDDLSTMVTGGGWNSDYQLRIWDVFRSEGITASGKSSLAVLRIIPNLDERSYLVLNRKSLIEFDAESGQQNIIKEKLAVQHSELTQDVLYLCIQDGGVFEYHLSSRSWKEFFRHSQMVTAFCMTEEGSCLLGDWKGNLVVVKGGQKVFEQNFFKQKITTIQKVAVGYVIYTFTDEFIYFDLEQLEFGPSYSHPKRITTNLLCLENNLCFGDTSGSIVLLDPETWDVRTRKQENDIEFTVLAAHEKYKRIVVGSEKGLIQIWSWDLSQMLVEISAHNSNVHYIELLGEECFISIPGNYYMDPRINNNYIQDNTVKKWDIISGECLAAYPLEEIVTTIAKKGEGFVLGLRNGVLLEFK